MQSLDCYAYNVIPGQVSWSGFPPSIHLSIHPSIYPSIHPLKFILLSVIDLLTC